MAALVGLMFMVAIGTFEWVSLKTFKKILLFDILVMVLLILITAIWHNLVIAVLIGVVLSALAISGKMPKEFAPENMLMNRA